MNKAHSRDHRYSLCRDDQIMADCNSTALPVSSTQYQLVEQVRKLSASLTPQDLDATLSTLRRIFNNIIQHPSIVKSS